MRFATYTSDNRIHYGAVTDAGMIALNHDFPKWPTLFEAVVAGGLGDLARAADGKPVTHAEFRYEMVLPNARRILCVGSISRTAIRNTKTARISQSTCPFFRVLPAALPVTTVP